MTQLSWSRPALWCCSLLVAAACNKAPLDAAPPDPLTPASAPEPVIALDDRVGRVAAPQAPPAQPDPPLTLQPSITYEPAGARSLNEVLSVTVHVEVHGSKGPHELIAQFAAPGGMPFERRAKPIDGTALDVHTADFVLPVQGTMIPQTGLSGTWAVALFHDGVQLSAPTFELTP